MLAYLEMEVKIEEFPIEMISAVIEEMGVKIKEHSIKKVMTEYQPFKCGQCETSFRHKSNFLRHQRIHSGEKPFQCGQCDKRFNLKYSFIMHQHVIILINYL